MKEIIECIPNISEGLDLSKIERLAACIRQTPGVRLLHEDVGPDANRTVFTFAGDRSAIFAAAYALIDAGIQAIDMRYQKGAHPRIGAIDVCPFVPIQGISVEELIFLHQAFVKKVADRFGLPVFLYEMSQPDLQRKKLENLRIGGFEKLEERMKAGFRPDFGPSLPHPTAGAMVSGVRPFLVALNFSLDTRDVLIAKRLARQVRTSGYTRAGQRIHGRFKALKSIGWWMPEYDCVQVSCNFTNLDMTSIHEVHSVLKELAQEEGVKIIGAEPIGLIPMRCFQEAAVYYKFSGSLVEKIEAVSRTWGLDLHKPFHPKRKIIELVLQNKEE